MEQKPFVLQSLIERMWLATLLLVLAALQCYLFKSVIRCSKYLSTIEFENRRRESEFERVSEKVRMAKQNGLWRTTSWGGGIEEYKGQYDKKEKKKTNKGFHVQWGKLKVENEEKGETEEISILSIGSSAPKLEDLAEKFSKKERRGSDEDQPPIACTSSSVVEPDDVNERRHHSESLRKEKKARSIRKAESDCGQSSSIYSGQYDVLEELEQPPRKGSTNVMIEVKLPNTSQASDASKNRRKHSRSNEREFIEVKDKSDSEKRRGILTEEKIQPQKVGQHKTSRRRSSEEFQVSPGQVLSNSTNSTTSGHHHRGSRHHENLFVKKVSITTNL
ncbi:hypothetical protein WR25_14846 [Diploscapter pachys]|uniref:Uncharacterized protein n=1 Tax=Diploscapter pachys TaxID=2018661 RepID=A0A2A2KN33_9BILA|nr:hypothetical protein WR25_14846 [Diploscapter pachys]